MDEMTFLLLAGAGALGASGIVWDRLAVDSNRRKTSGDHLAKVLTNLPRFRIGSTYIPPGFVESVCASTLTEMDITAEWKYGATFDDLVEAVNNDKYQSIVVVGEEGNLGRYNWVARGQVVDGVEVQPVITAETLRKACEGNPAKEGYWFQYTTSKKIDIPSHHRKEVALLCMETERLGYDHNVPMGHYVMKDPGKILGFKKKVGRFGLYLIEPTVIGKSQEKGQ